MCGDDFDSWSRSSSAMVDFIYHRFGSVHFQAPSSAQRAVHSGAGERKRNAEATHTYVQQTRGLSAYSVILLFTW